MSNNHGEQNSLEPVIGETLLAGTEAVKSKNQQKNEEKRKAKLEKFAAKQEKQKTVAASKPKAESGKDSKDYAAAAPKYKDDTIPGEKKNLSQPMLPAYSPSAVESSWYAWWEKSGFFKPECHGTVTAETPKYTISIPPPNVTGSLHLGHAMMTSIQDAIIRWKRMQGFAALYVPGCDHAGIATQVVVEKKLKKERNLLKHDLGREEFVKEIWKWKEANGDRIYHQFKSMGVSVDWDRKKFTLDDDMNEAVNEAFVKLHDQGLIFRDVRLVNWCGKIKTSLSDLEVDNKTIEPNTMMSIHGHDPNKKYKLGVMYHFAYKVADSDNQELVIATTRPETILGDSAVAVNPNDARYKAFHGKFVIHPVHGTRIPIITDEYVDVEFGTGCLKVTPAHDKNDFDLGKKHGLKFINIFDEENAVNENGGPLFQGLKRFDAREAMIEFLKKNDLYRGDVPHAMEMPFCSRSGDIVEPRLKPQWWLNCKSMADSALAAVHSKEIEMIPPEAEKVWDTWLENIRDWCLSRQLWWGHRIPAYMVEIKGQKFDEADTENWIIASTEAEALQKAVKKYPNVPIDSISLKQDEDVLDTWFSSGLWPFAILGWPKSTPDLANFYPNQVLETGKDILFFWVARMVMMGIHLTGQIPFTQILLHSIVRDAHGRKMEKSRGNVIDPLDVMAGITLQELHEKLEKGNLDQTEIEKAKAGQKQDYPKGIPECGTDALRFALCAFMSQDRDVNLDIQRIEGYRKFCNKIWQVARFSLMKFGADFTPVSDFQLTGSESLTDKWIVSRLNAATQATNNNLEAFNFMAATSAVYQFIWDELCGVYVEYMKPFCSDEDPVRKSVILNILYTCLESALKLLHPFMPFITEELWQRLPKRATETAPSISLARFPVPVPAWNNSDAERDFGLINDISRAIRSIKMECNIVKGGSFIIECQRLDRLVASELDTVHALCGKLSSLALGKGTNSEGSKRREVSSDISIHLID